MPDTITVDPTKESRDDTEYTAEDAYKDVQDAEETTDGEEETVAPQTDPGDEQPDVTPDEDEPEPEPEEEEDEPDLAAKLALDEEVASQLPPEVAKRYQEQVKGLAKKHRQLNETVDQVGFVIDYALGLSKPETRNETLSKILAETAELHKTTPEALISELGFQAPTPEPAEFEYETDAIVHDKAVDTATKKVFETLGASPDEVKALLGLLRETKADKETQEWLKTNASPIKAAAAKTVPGWEPTDEQILSSKKRFPSEKPLQALKMAFPDDYAKAVAGAKKEPKKVPTLHDTAQTKTPIPIPVEEYRAEHAYAELQS